MLWNGFWQIARLVAGFLSWIVVANFLSKDSYGSVARLTAVSTTFGLIADFGVERGLAKFLPEIELRYGRSGVRRTLQLVLAQKVIIALLIIVGCLIFRQRLFDYWESGRKEELPANYLYVFLAALIMLVFLGAVFDVFMQTLTAYFRQRASGAIGFVEKILTPLLRLGVLLIGWGLFGFVGVLVLVPLVVTGLAAWQMMTIRRELIIKPTLPATNARVPQRLVAYSAVSYWQQLTEYLHSLDFVLWFVPDVAVAASLKQAYNLVGQVLSALWSPLAGIQTPLFTRLHTRGDREQLAVAYQLLSKFLVAVMLPAGVGLVLLVYNLLAVVSARYIDAAGVAAILTITLFLDAAISVPLSILMVYEQFRPMLVARTCALIAAPLVFFLVPQFGMLAAALIIGGVRLFCDSIAMGFVLKLFSLRYPVRFASRVALATLAMAVVVAPLAFTVLRTPVPWQGEHPLARSAQILYGLGNAALAGVGGLVYLGVFKLTGGIDPEDRQRIVELRLPFAARLLRFL